MRPSPLTNRLFALLLALMVGLTFSMADTEPSYAASKPGAVKTVTTKTLSQTSIKVSWKKAKRATGYQLFRNETLIMKGKARSFTDTKLKPGLKYTYVVRAYRKTSKGYKYGPFSPMKVAATKAGKPAVKKTVLKILVPKSEDKNIGRFVARYNATDNPYIIKIIKTGTAKGIDPAKYDGLIIPGGKHVHPSFYHAKVKCKKHKYVKSLDRLEIALVKLFIKKKKPVLGICRGCQLINVTLGGTLKQDIGKGHYHDKSRKTNTKKSTDMRKLYGASVKTLHYHHQAIGKLAKGLKVTMVDAKDGTIEGTQHRTLPVVGIQFHPDRMYVKKNPGIRRNGRIVMTYFFDICCDLRADSKPAPSAAPPAADPAQPSADDPGAGNQDPDVQDSSSMTDGEQTSDRPAVRILLYGSDCSSIEAFTASYNEHNNSYSIELTHFDTSVAEGEGSAVRSDPADYDALIVTDNEEGAPLIDIFEGAGKSVLVMNPDSLEQDMLQLLQDIASTSA